MLNIPGKFLEILNKNRNLQGIVLKTEHDLSIIIEKSEFEFFPDYTDHRIDHLNRVLETCEFIIDEETYSHISAEDVTVLILSVLLHDIGMHLTHEGLVSILKSDTKISSFDNKSWSELWEEFYQEIKKMKESDLIDIFGSSVGIERPPLEKDNLTRIHRKLYGEFIRRHHPRLAHEIALNGFPTETSYIPFANELDIDIKEIIGLVARSHGINLRSTFGYLERRFGKVWRTPRNVKIIFLMTVLRISDYLHITSERAPQITLNTKKISSTISKKEWELHHSIKEISYNLLDPESVYIVASPKNSDLFLKIQKLMVDIQKELDTSWGILGEVYGSLVDFKNLKMKLRRIQSNLDDVIEFSQTVRYLPQKVRCDSDPELLKLLIAPLYGDDPTYGIRELLQNAIDACRERKMLLESRKSSMEYTPKIILTIEEVGEEGFFIIEDNGIGMTEKVIVDYFLKAGASFRNSQLWKQEFKDSNNKSIVQRSGRFGVGVFAGFLIGSEMIIKTRHFDSETSYEFSVRMDQSQIEVSKSTGDIGTAISIKLTSDVLVRLKNQLLERNSLYVNKIAWSEWYELEEPEMILKIPGEWSVPHRKRVFPLNEVTTHTIYPEDFKEVKWTFDYFEGSPSLYCNGIVIPSQYSLNNFDYPRGSNHPLVSVSDYDGKLPLSLNRNELFGDLPFEEELFSDISKDVIAYILQKDVLQFDSFGKFTAGKLEIEHPIFQDRIYWAQVNDQRELLLFKEGFCLFHSFCIEKMNIKNISKLWVNDLDDLFLNSEDQLNGITISNRKVSAIHDYRKLMDVSVIGTDRKYNVISKRIIISKEKYYYLTEKDRLRKGFRKDLVVESEGKHMISIVQGNPDSPTLDFDIFEDNHSKVNLYIEYSLGNLNEREHSYRTKKPLKNTFEKVLEELFGDNVLIPYTYNDRVLKYKELFNKLLIYLNKYK